MNRPKKSTCRISKIEFKRLIAKEVARCRREDERYRERYYSRGDRYRGWCGDLPPRRRRRTEKDPIGDDIGSSSNIMYEIEIDHAEPSASSANNANTGGHTNTPKDLDNSIQNELSEFLNVNDDEEDRDVGFSQDPLELSEEGRLKKIENKIEMLTKTLEMQNSMISNNNLLLAKLWDRLNASTEQPIIIFPIESVEQLQNLDAKLEQYSEADILLSIKQTIGPAKIEKCFDKFFSDDVLLKINWHGKYNATALKEMKLFKKYVFECVKSENFGYSHYVAAMIGGLRLAKTRYYKKVHDMKKKLENNALGEIDDSNLGDSNLDDSNVGDEEQSFKPETYSYS